MVEKMRNKAFIYCGLILSLVIAASFFLSSFILSNAQEIPPPRNPLREGKAIHIQTKDEVAKPAGEEPLVPAGREADITIFFTGEAIGYIEECG
ncbi:MAG: hypothetical protein AB1756_03190 [Acidobacteriota bacterium]